MMCRMGLVRVASSQKSCLRPRTMTRTRLMTDVPWKNQKIVLLAEQQSSRKHHRRFGAFRNLWDSYDRILHQYPLLVKTCMAATIFFTSDSIMQFLQSSSEEFQYDVSRALSGASFGVIGTTGLHFWWSFLEGFVGARIPIKQHKVANAFCKVFLQQTVWAPFYVYTYYIVTNFAHEIQEFRNISDAVQTADSVHCKASEMLWPTLLRHWRVWPFVQTFNFYFMPLHHRMFVQNAVLVGWSGYLSYLNNGGLKSSNECTAMAARKNAHLQILEEEDEEDKLRKEVFENFESQSM